jgi:hypothetical protein
VRSCAGTSRFVDSSLIYPAHRTGLSGAVGCTTSRGQCLLDYVFPFSSPFRPDSAAVAAAANDSPTHRLIRQQKPTDSTLPSLLSSLTLSIKNLRASNDMRFCFPAFAHTQFRGTRVRGIMCAHAHKSGFCFRDMTNNQYTYLCQPPLLTRRRTPHKPPGPTTNCFTTLPPFPP